MRNTRKVVLAGLAALAASLAVVGHSSALQVGDKAPDFTLAGPGGEQVKLSDLTAKGPVIVYTFIQAFSGP
jgi:hypothetical protein